MKATQYIVLIALGLLLIKGIHYMVVESWPSPQPQLPPPTFREQYEQMVKEDNQEILKAEQERQEVQQTLQYYQQLAAESKQEVKRWYAGDSTEMKKRGIRISTTHHK